LFGVGVAEHHLLAVAPGPARSRGRPEGSQCRFENRRARGAGRRWSRTAGRCPPGSTVSLFRRASRQTGFLQQESPLPAGRRRNGHNRDDVVGPPQADRRWRQARGGGADDCEFSLRAKSDSCSWSPISGPSGVSARSARMLTRSSSLSEAVVGMHLRPRRATRRPLPRGTSEFCPHVPDRTGENRRRARLSRNWTKPGSVGQQGRLPVGAQ